MRVEKRIMVWYTRERLKGAMMCLGEEEVDMAGSLGNCRKFTVAMRLLSSFISSSMEQIFLKGIHVNLPSLGAHTQGGSELFHFPSNRLAPLLLLIEQRERELILHHFLPQAGDHSMALVLKIWCIGYAMRHQT